jgi:two-component system chemotaxis response regulator CheB
VQRDVVVIGASAGGVAALRSLVAGLPADLPAAVLVVLHIPPRAPSALPTILSRSGPLPAAFARGGERLEPGRIYVAPPDHHLTVVDGHVVLSVGPRENGHRPAVDVLFRTAARALGPRVIGVVLSGALDDGTAGLLAVAGRNGMTVVQDPAEALYPDMPLSAVRQVGPDHVLGVDQIAGLLGRSCGAPVDSAGTAEADPTLRTESEIALLAADAILADDPLGHPSALTCPDCHGVLHEVQVEPRSLRCRVGHAWTATSLAQRQDLEVESALWAALRSLEEKADLLGRMAEDARAQGRDSSAARFADRAADSVRAARVLRDLVSESPGRATDLPDDDGSAGSLAG